MILRWANFLITLEDGSECQISRDAPACKLPPTSLYALSRTPGALTKQTVQFEVRRQSQLPCTPSQQFINNQSTMGSKKQRAKLVKAPKTTSMSMMQPATAGQAHGDLSDEAAVRCHCDACTKPPSQNNNSDSPFLRMPREVSHECTVDGCGTR